MRLEAQMKGGFYPCPREAIDQLVAKVTPCDGATLLDPCAGRGEAAKWLAEGLGIAEEDVYAVELEEGHPAQRRQVKNLRMRNTEERQRHALERRQIGHRRLPAL